MKIKINREDVNLHIDYEKEKASFEWSPTNQNYWAEAILSFDIFCNVSFGDGIVTPNDFDYDYRNLDFEYFNAGYYNSKTEKERQCTQEELDEIALYVLEYIANQL